MAASAKIEATPLQADGTVSDARVTDGVGAVTVVYSAHRDLYRVADGALWLSTLKTAGAAPEALVPRTPFLGCFALERGWRKAYSLDWSVIQPGAVVTLPADDVLVTDYLVVARQLAVKE